LSKGSSIGAWEEIGEPEDDFYEIGMNWLIFGKLSVLAYEENERNKDKVNQGLLAHMSPEHKHQIMTSAASTIKDIKELHKTIKKKNEITQSQMNTALSKVRHSMADNGSTIGHDRNQKENIALQTITDNS